MLAIAWKNLIHDRVRLVVTLVGIVFALVLILVQVGLFLGFLDTSSNIVGHSNADLWITAPSIPHVNGGAVLSENHRYLALGAPGVERVERYSVFFVNWKLPTGAQESVQVVGFHPDSDMGGPWNLTQGSVQDLWREDAVIIDELYRDKLGVKEIGQTFEINGRRARIVGFTRGIRSFTTSPYVYTTFKNSQNYIGLDERQTIYFLVRLSAGADAAAVQTALQRRLPDVDVLTNAQMLDRTKNYWLFGTGAGSTTIMGAVLGLIVGIVVVAQTLYAATMDHIREFGTLKAMGATNGHIYQVILAQAFMSGIAGYAIALGVALLVSKGAESGNAPILIPPLVAAGAVLLALVMCAGASLISIRKATTIDPAMVFRG